MTTYYTEFMVINRKVKQIWGLCRSSRVGLVILAEIAAGLVFALTSLWAFTEIADEVVEKETAAFDNTIQEAVYSLRDPVLTRLIFFISFLGSKEFLFAVSLAVIVIFSAKNKRRAATTYTAILLLSAGLNNLIKFAVHRDRPTLSPIEEASFYSFPSGHSMNSLVFYGLLAYYAFHYTRNRKLGFAAYAAAFITVAAIGFSRVYLGAHYPTDVLAGFLAGICVLASAIAIDKTLKLNKLLKESKPG